MARRASDLSICDLSFFRALSCQTEKARRMRDGASMVPLWEKDKLADDVVQAFKDYPVDQLDKMWRYKACVVSQWATRQTRRRENPNYNEREAKTLVTTQPVTCFGQ